MQISPASPSPIFLPMPVPTLSVARPTLQLDLLTLFGALLSTFSAAFLLWLCRRNERFTLLIEKGNGGKYVRAILLVSFYSGLSSVPYLLLSIGQLSQVCPFLWLHLLALFRVFSLRFEISQCLCLALDRLIVSFEPNSSKFRPLRRRLFWPLHGICFVLALLDLVIACWKHQPWPAYSFDCTLLSVASPLFVHWHFFLLNFLTLTLGVALVLGQFLCHPIHVISSPIRKRLSTLTNWMLLAFCVALACVVAVQLADRFFLDFEEERRLRNFADLAFQLLHLSYLPAIVRYAPGKLTSKIQTITSTNTLDLGGGVGGPVSGFA